LHKQIDFSIQFTTVLDLWQSKNSELSNNCKEQLRTTENKWAVTSEHCGASTEYADITTLQMQTLCTSDYQLVSVVTKH